MPKIRVFLLRDAPHWLPEVANQGSRISANEDCFIKNLFRNILNYSKVESEYDLFVCLFSG